MVIIIQAPAQDALTEFLLYTTPDGKEMLDTLKVAVNKALEKKKRLGH